MEMSVYVVYLSVWCRCPRAKPSVVGQWFCTSVCRCERNLCVWMGIRVFEQRCGREHVHVDVETCFNKGVHVNTYVWM